MEQTPSPEDIQPRPDFTCYDFYIQETQFWNQRPSGIFEGCTGRAQELDIFESYTNCCSSDHICNTFEMCCDQNGKPVPDETCMTKDLLINEGVAPGQLEKIFKITQEMKRSKQPSLFKVIHHSNKFTQIDSNKPQNLMKFSYVKSKGLSRKDVTYKAALRLLRRHFKNMFKIKNLDIDARRLYSLAINDVYQRTLTLLTELIPEEYLTEDLVYYTIGIIGIKKASEMQCKSSIKKEITAFKRCTKSFSHNNLEKAFHSNSLMTLCWYIIQRSDDQRISVLRTELLEITAPKPQEK
ncbi:unnamed protein product [Moneuplotes crassus]|uniref:Uncharacterized protein n=1 Tax=Euplotes crassus TaxID=5936 RepID=A0AAD1UA70_EUPCR|nr:unnamed protein product [Moneuplotes crassus]